MLLYLLSLAYPGIPGSHSEPSPAQKPPAVLTDLPRISGTLHLIVPGANWEGDCAGTSLVHAGTTVTLLDEFFQPLASAPLEGGVAGEPDVCTFEFSIVDPPRAQNYFFEIGGHVSDPVRMLYAAAVIGLPVEMTITEGTSLGTPVVSPFAVESRPGTATPAG